MRRQVEIRHRVPDPEPQNEEEEIEQALEAAEVLAAMQLVTGDVQSYSERFKLNKGKVIINGE